MKSSHLCWMHIMYNSHIWYMTDNFFILTENAKKMKINTNWINNVPPWHKVMPMSCMTLGKMSRSVITPWPYQDGDFLWAKSFAMFSHQECLSGPQPLVGSGVGWQQSAGPSSSCHLISTGTRLGWLVFRDDRYSVSLCRQDIYIVEYIVSILQSVIWCFIVGTATSHAFSDIVWVANNTHIPLTWFTKDISLSLWCLSRITTLVISMGLDISWVWILVLEVYYLTSLHVLVYVSCIVHVNV